jgi:DNA-directed RNA polymerase subunit RPC12/RpoP
MIDWKCQNCGETVQVTRPLAALETDCPRCGQRILRKESPPSAESAAEAYTSLPVASDRAPPGVLMRTIGTVLGGLAGVGGVYLIVTQGGSGERTILLALGGGLLGLALGLFGAWIGVYFGVAGPMRPQNPYDLKYLAGFLAVIGLLVGFAAGANMDQPTAMTLQKALAVRDDPSEEAAKTLDQNTLSRLTPAQRAAAERGQRQFLRKTADRYLVSFIAGSLGAVVLGSLFGRALGAMLGECVEVVRSKRN